MRLFLFLYNVGIIHDDDDDDVKKSIDFCYNSIIRQQFQFTYLLEMAIIRI